MAPTRRLTSLPVGGLFFWCNMMQTITFDCKLFLDDDDIVRSRKALLWMMTALVGINITFLSRFRRTPPLYSAGVRYQREEGTELWQDIPRTLELGYGDCEDLACWRVAELNVAGVRAKPYIKWRNDGPKKSQYHATVLWPDGRVEDPSASLGMNDLPIVGRPLFVDPGPMV